MRKIIALLLGCFLIGCVSHNNNQAAPHKHSHFTKHYEKSLFQKTNDESYSVEMVLPAEGFKVGDNKVDLIFHDRRDNDVTGAVISVSASMNMPGHHMEPPAIIERGGGLYTVDNLNLPTAGPWDLLVKINKNGVWGETTFKVIAAKEGDHAGMHHHAEIDPAKLDFSTTSNSFNKLFEVSYRPDSKEISLNSMHAWKVTVKSAAGAPVLGAKFKISGGMPAHGHGLPTNPAMTRELGGGVYLIEGVRFSMPGVWEFILDISAAGSHDTVKFNLNL